MIDEFSEENRKGLALALKKYWQDKGKWERGKSKKTKAVKKQLLRVQKIKEILGEE